MVLTTRFIADESRATTTEHVAAACTSSESYA